MTFGVMDFLLLLLIAGVCGGIAQAIAGFTRGGCLVSIGVGFIGALIGLGLKRAFELPELLTLEVGDVQFPVVWSILGGVVFAVIVGLLTRPAPPPRD